MVPVIRMMAMAVFFISVFVSGLQGRFHVKSKFEGIREDEGESLQADLAPLTSDSLRYSAPVICRITCPEWHADEVHSHCCTGYDLEMFAAV